MTTISVQSQYPMFFDTSGAPLSGGSLYFGKINTNPSISSNQIPVYWDSEFTQPVAQPIKTTNGAIYRSGTPANVYTKENFSISIYDKSSRLVAYFPVGQQILSGPGGSNNIGFIQEGNGAIERTVQDELRDEFNVKQFGAKGDYVTDDYLAINVADVVASMLGKALIFPDGQYRSSNGILRKAIWKGSAAPVLGTFPISADDKIYLRPGYKTKMPGVSLIFSGAGTATATTIRTDRFSSFTYCVMDDPSGPPQEISGIAIVMDMDVYDAGGALTTPVTDNRSAYDVGYYGTTGWTKHSNLVVFGYFPKAGTLLYGADIDYNTFDETCSTSGDIGLAIVGNGTNGLSGTQYAGRIFANDHHSRSIVYNQWGTTALYIDGNVPGASAPANSIGGHYFTGSIRTYCDNPFVLGYANTVVFDGCVFEWPNLAGSTGATKAFPIGTLNTYGVVFENCRHLSPVGTEGIYDFAKSIGGAFIHSDPRHGNLGVAYAGKAAMLRSSGGNPTLQLTKDINGTTTDWTHLENLSSADRLETRYNNSLMASLTTAGVFTASRLVAVATGSSSAADPSVRLSGSDASTGFFRSAANNIGVAISGTKVFDWQTDGVPRPGADNTYSMGSGSFRWSVFFGATGIINTSDAREKTEVRPFMPNEILAAKAIAREIGIFQFLGRIVEKGEDARLHVGMTVQRAIEILISHEMDPFRFAFICHDEWEDQYQVIDAVMRETGELDGEGEPILVIETPERTELIQASGDRYGFRMDQLLAFCVRGLAAGQEELEERVLALEARA